MSFLLKALSLTLISSLLFCGGLLPSSAADTISGGSAPRERAADVNPSALSVSAYSAALIDASDGNLLYSKRADEPLPMASTTKIMTALVAIERGDLDATVEIPRAAVGVEGSSIYLFTGEKLTLGNLVYALMLASANDAAAAIAIIVGGSIEKFAGMMNEKAAELGLSNTRFVNPHGLDAAGHHTTARDLALLSAYALGNDTFKKIVSTKKTTIPLNGEEGRRLLINHNRLLRYYDGAIGVKTGFTRKSGRCLVSAAERDGLIFVAVTINAPNDWNDHTRMLDYGFSSYVRLKLEERGNLSITMPLVGGVCDWVMLTNSEAVEVTLPKTHGKVSFVIEAPRFLYAPVKSGERVGRIVYYSDGEEIASSPLFTVNAVEKPKKTGFLGWLMSIFGVS